jgi:hypothetical protein
VRAVGEDCSLSTDCYTDLECVAFRDQRICLPRPEERAPASCDNECLGVEPLWPVEASCIEGHCRCEPTAFDCDVPGTTVDENGDRVVDPATCVCRPRAEGGESCDGEVCVDGLHCVDGVCVVGN